MENYFNYIFYGDIKFGIGSRHELSNIIKKNNFDSVCIILDHALKSISIFENLINTIGCDKTLVYCDIKEPTYDRLEEKREILYDKSIDAFIGIGGGSALDMAKGLSVLYSNKGSAISYRGFDQFQKPILPIIAIPTTAGTGSEITPNASFIDTAEKKKLGINGEAIRPKYAILDPELTLSCPKAPTVSAGVDSLVHATEAFAAKKSNVMAKMFAKNGFKLVFNNLPKLAQNLDDIELREKVMYGAFLSAIALMNSGTGPAAAMSYPLGVHYGVPHGIGGGVFLPHVIQHNINAGYIDYIELMDKNEKKSERKASIKFIDKVWQVWEELTVPQDLKDFGMIDKDTDRFISDTMDLKLALDQNPVPFYENEIKSTLKKLNIN
jgi:alcohol dehydrogenase class IV